MNSAIINYLIRFLLGVDCLDIKNAISYTNDDVESVESSVIIRPSTFFDKGVYGTNKTIPQLPLKEINGMPFLYGEPIIENKKGKMIIHADLIASAYFLVSRYEEVLRPDIRDLHGRFPGKESLPYRAGFIDRPIIDEYGGYLRDILRKIGMVINDPKPSFCAINLTHDIDHPWEDFNIVTALKRIMGIIKREHRFDIYPILNCVGLVERDPLYTFPWIIDNDNRIQRRYADTCKVIYFAKSGGVSKPMDGFIYINTKAFKRMLSQIRESGAILGYHASYDAGIDPKLIDVEVKTLSQITGENICLSRNHYLNSREPQDMHKLIKNGITDDFTMGYADVTGFRIGTSRSVLWIDPEKVELTKLLLHPLTIMEGTLSEKHYMNMSEEDAAEYANKLILQTKKYNGELTLLWHNTSVIDDPKNRDRKLYEKIINDLCSNVD